MKRFFFLFTILLVGLFVYTIVSWTPGNSKDGIKFFEGTWREAINKAQQEHKPIFLDIYATWCGPCKMLKKKTFSNKEVGSYFNAKYINLSVNGETGEGEMLANRFRITGYPTLIILDENGNVVTTSVGYLPPDDLLAFAQQANPNK